MIAKAGKKILASMMALILVFGNVPAIAFAGSVETNPIKDGSLVVTYEGPVDVNEMNGNIHINAAPETDASSMIPFFTGTTGSVTLTNQSGDNAILSFDYAVQGNRKSLTIGGESYSGSGTWTGTVESGASIEVALSGNDSDGAAKLAMGNFALYNGIEGKMVYLGEVVNGTVTGENNETIFKTTYEVGATVSAVPDEGYQFVAWVDENNQILSTEANTTLHPVTHCTVTAVFAAADEPYFKVAGKLFVDLNAAAIYAKESGIGLVVPMKDATVSAGDYEIPAGVVLLIPFDVEENCYLDKPQTAGVEFVEPETYCKLTFAEGANLTVNGELSVSAKHTSGYNSTKTGGTPTESVGMVELLDGSTITIAKDASAYAWGYVIGSGNMIAESGSSIYEIMQIADFRGGSATLALLNTPVLPFSQYYIQNIEAPLTLHGGANEYAYTTLTATLGGITVTSSAGIKFIGEDGAMFSLKKGTEVTKKYDPNKDRLMLETKGDFSLNSMELTAMGQTMKTYGFNLPINNNITIDIQSGHAVIKQNTAFQPGVELSVDKGATVSVATQEVKGDDGTITTVPTNLYIYDADDWGGFTFGGAQFVDIAYSPTKAYTRTVENDIKDVVVDINGRFIVESGNAVYTTAGGAQVTSSEGTGSVEFNNNAGTLAETMQADGEANVVKIPITSVQLKNQNGSYVETKNVVGGDGFVVDNGAWIPATDVTLTYDANGGAYVGDEGSNVQKIEKLKILEGEETTLKAAGNLVERKGYVFKGWNTAADGSGTAYANEEVVRLVKNTTLYAQWEGKPYTITFVNYDNSVIAEITAPYGTPITYPEVPSLEGYTFSKWNDDTVTTMPEGDRTIKAVHTANPYTITFDTDGGSEVEAVTAGYNTNIKDKEPPAPTKAGYDFAGWEPAYPEKMPLNGATLKAKWEVAKYTISFNTDGGSKVEDIVAEYGMPVTKPENPTKEGYTFIGWNAEFPETMPENGMELKAQWRVNQYTISFDTDGGSAVAPIEANYGALIEPPVAPVKEGYTFDGWSKELPGKMPAEDLVLKAQWKVNQYTITFDTDGGSVVAPVTADFGSKVTAPADPTREGYTFAGWDTEIPETMPAEYLTIKALWTANKYTISFDTDGGSAVAPITADFGTVINAPKAPVKEGYVFVGWSAEVPSKMPAKNLELKAVWTVNQYTITFDTDGGSAVAPITADFGTVINAPKAPVKEGYVFVGWSAEVPSKMPAQNMTVKATYIKVLDAPTPSAKADHANGKITVSWTAVNGAAKYEVYRSVKADAGFTKVDTTTGTNYVDASTAVGTPYYYYVIAIHGENAAANSVKSTVVSAEHHHDWADATCTAAKTCKVCGETEGAALPHAYEDVITKATTSKDGKIVKKCDCGNVGTTTVIKKASKVSLSKTTAAYTGKTLKAPTITVKDSAGKTIAKENYTISKPSKSLKNVGEYTYTIKFKGNYSGTKKLTYTITPKSTSVTKLTAAKKAFTVKLSKVSKEATGYEVMYATNSKFTKGKKTVKITSYKTTSKKISKLSAKKTYYVKVRTYKKVSGKTYYSDWSKAKTVKTR